MLSPRQTFEDNLRPATLLLQLYELLDCNDRVLMEGERVTALRALVNASGDEYLMVIENALLLGLIRERARITPPTLQRKTMSHLLRQSVVISCTALETFLPALLRAQLPIVIRAVGRDFVPVNDPGVAEYFKDLTFSLDETMRLMSDPNAAEYISNRILGLANFKYLSTRKGIHVVGRLLGLTKPWDQILAHLGLDLEKRELMEILDRTVTRRNDVVHRADRNQEHPEGDQQEITYAWARQSVDTIQHLCLALDELVTQRIQEYAALVEANTADG
jgi:hypothetical protein